MNKLFLLIVALVCIASGTNAQRYAAQVLDQTDNRPVAYANIGILGTETGTNSDSAGYFSLTVGPEAQGKTLLISMIGYEEYKVPVSTFTSAAGNGQKILLKRNNKLSEVVVRPTKLTADELGNSYQCEEKALPFPYLFEKKRSKKVRDTLTEVGTLMKVKRKKTFIDSVEISVGKCTYENIFYRLNIYEEQDGEFKNILQEPIYISRSRAEVGNKIRVNLRDKNLVVNHNFIVSLEKVKDLGPGEFTICGKLMGAPMYMRIATQHDRFIKVPLIGMGIAAFVTFSEEMK